MRKAKLVRGRRTARVKRGKPLRRKLARRIRRKKQLKRRVRLHPNVTRQARKQPSVKQHTLAHQQLAYEAGAADGARDLALVVPKPMSDEDKRRIVEAYQRGLNVWFHQHMVPRPSFADAAQVCLAYRQGYADAAGIKAELQRSVPLPLRGSASVVITVCNEEETIGQLLHELDRLPVYEKVVVLNGCTDRSLERAAESPDSILVSYRERLGHDVGRAIGATLTSGDIVLFLDGDMLVPAEELAAFLYAVDGGADAALNDITPFLPSFPQQDQVTRCKLFLNQALGRPDLQANSLTAVPHALSRKAIATVGSSALGVPPKAQAIAILEGLQVCAPCSVDVIGRNRIRPGNTGMGNQVAKLIVGDHVEALQEAMRRHGRRLLWQTNSRAVLAAERNLSLMSEQSVHHKKRKTDQGGGEP